MSVRSWWQHAFAVDTQPAEPSAAEQDVVDRLCREIVRRGLTTPALAFLEMSRPLNYLGAQALHYLAPMISAIVDSADHRQLATFLERRDAFDRICRGVEAANRANTPPDEPRDQGGRKP